MSAPADLRADALARLFEAVHQGVYIGLLGATTSRTLAANPHLKLMLGYPADAAEADVRLFDAGRSLEHQTIAA